MPDRTVSPTPLVIIEGVHLKLECANPSGSVKDRIAGYMLAQAMTRGELVPGDTVVETTSGNTGIALAQAAARLGVRVLIFMPEHMSVERRQMMKQLGAEVRLTPRDEGFEGAVRQRDEFRGRPGFYVPDQFSNPDNAVAHEQTTAAELIAQLHEHGVESIDAFVAGVGTGGTLMGIGRALRRVMPNVMRVAVEPEESSVMLGGAAGDHGIMGIGDGFIPALVDMNEVDAVEAVSTKEAMATALRIRAEHGYCVGVSAGANLAAALRLRARGATVATLWPDRGDRYLSVGLQGPDGPGLRCDLQACCEARSRRLTGAKALPESQTPGG